MLLAILNYETGNVKSIEHALQRIGIEHILTNDIEELKKADSMILPGVANAQYAMEMIHQNNLFEFIKNYQKPLLGICLGMQILCDFSEENQTQCLGVFPHKVIKFSRTNLKVPQMGWNTISPNGNNLLTKEIGETEYVYYANSFYIKPMEETTAISQYGVDISAEIQKNNFFGLQFHPEKSGKVGETILKKFIKIASEKNF